MLTLAPKEPVQFENDRSPKRKLRVGMVSSNLKRHPVGYMILPGLDHTNKDLIEYVSYSDLLDDKKDDFTQRIKDNCTLWYDSAGMTDDELVAQIREDKVDLLLDLTGMLRAVHVLISLLAGCASANKLIGGLFDTSGLTEMDWIIGDPIEIPEGDDEWYTSAYIVCR